MRHIVSCGSTSFPWLVFFFGALLWGSMIHKHTGRWTDKERHQSYLGTERNLLSFQTGYNLVNAAVVCAVLESISGLEPLSVTTEARYFFFFSWLSNHNHKVDVGMCWVCLCCHIIIHQTLTWTTGSSSCAQMLINVIAHEGVWTPKESLHWNWLVRKSLAASG